MIVYVPTYFDECNYEPSWTGNHYYPTVTIRGIFDSLDKAEKAIEDWIYKEECAILIREIDEEEENEIKGFDLDYSNHVLEIIVNNYCTYKLNEIITESWSAVYDEEGLLGVSDY